MSMKSMKKASYQLSPFEVGQVKAHLEHDLTAAEIARRVKKSDGKTTFGETAILNCINKLQENPRWRGERAEGSARPRKTTASQDEKIVDFLFEERGKQKVSVRTLKKEFRFLRPLSNSLVEERWHEAELSWLRRRSKSIVEKEYLEDRVQYSHGVKRKHQSTLDRWAYTDGTVYYLDRSEAEYENSKRRALGTHVWRRSDNRDAMHQDCLGPSRYNKGQGVPVKVWGMLASGRLHIHILDEGETMNQDLYAELVEDKFEDWCGDCDWLVCDFETCIRCDSALHALSKTPLKLVENYPKRAQDFNAIENVWAILKERLDETMPRKLEGREDFIKRLKAAVRWANQSRKGQLWYLATNQKERADECLAAEPPGGRITF